MMGLWSIGTMASGAGERYPKPLTNKQRSENRFLADVQCVDVLDEIALTCPSEALRQSVVLTKVILAFSKALLDDLSERPGRNKFEKQRAAKPREALLKVLKRLSRDIDGGRSTSHLRADLFEEPLHTRRLYKPESLAALLSNFDSLTRIPEGCSFATSQPNGYIAMFTYKTIGWSILGGYVEVDSQPVLVFLRAMDEQKLTKLYKTVSSQASDFEEFFLTSDEVARDAT